MNNLIIPIQPDYSNKMVSNLFAFQIKNIASLLPNSMLNYIIHPMKLKGAFLLQISAKDFTAILEWSRWRTRSGRSRWLFYRSDQNRLIIEHQFRIKDDP